MSTEPAYPYQVLCTLSADDGEALKAAAARRETSVRALLREYVRHGLADDQQHGSHAGRHFRVPLTLAGPIASALMIAGERKGRTAQQMVRDYVVLGLAADLLQQGDAPSGELLKTWTEDEGEPTT